MSYDPHKRDASWQMIQPGCYLDPAGHAHLFPDEILAFLAAMHPGVGFNPNSKDDYDLVVKMFVEQLNRIKPGQITKFIRHDRGEN
jgi:hypothetical protein